MGPPPQKQPFFDPRAGAASIRVGTAPRPQGTAAAPIEEEAHGLPDGPPLTSVAPQFEARTLTVVAFDAPKRAIDVKDRRNLSLRIQQTGKAVFLVEVAVGRERPAVTPLSMSMGKQLVLALHEAVERASSDPRLECNRAGMADFVRALANAAQMSVDTSAIVGSSTAASTVARERVHYAGTEKQHHVTGYRPIKSAPPAQRLPPAPSDGALAKAAAALDLETLAVESFGATQSVITLADQHGHQLVVQQIKFTPPPQFRLKYTPKGGETQHMEVPAPLARELVSVLAHSVDRSSETATDGLVKLAALMIQALNRVM
jgi:hypothetical protein